MSDPHKAISLLALALAMLLAGCSQPTEAPTGSGEAEPKPSGFYRVAGGTLAGRVIWEGTVPSALPLEVRPNPLLETNVVYREHPNRPHVDPNSHGVAEAVVFLRSVEPGRTRPWDHPPVRVEHQGLVMSIKQGDVTSRVGFVRRGDAIEVVSREAVFHSLRCRGADSFNLPLPVPERITRRLLGKPGLLELSSGAGLSWLHAYLFVSEHPYFTRTDKAGHFALEGIPEGNYQAVCWHPSWQPAGHERNPEGMFVMARTFAPPVEKHEPVTIEAARDGRVDFTLSAADFPP